MIPPSARHSYIMSAWLMPSCGKLCQILFTIIDAGLFRERSVSHSSPVRGLVYLGSPLAGALSTVAPEVSRAVSVSSGDSVFRQAVIARTAQAASMADRILTALFFILERFLSVAYEAFKPYHAKLKGFVQTAL